MPRDGSGIYSRPPGTNAVPDTTIESTKYNNFVGDVETDLNAPRPVIAGGTGANNATAARANLAAEARGIQVTNYDSHVFEAGSFYSEAGATGAPSANYCLGICYAINSAGMFIEARDHLTEILYTRKRAANVWSAWVQQASSLFDTDTRYVNTTGDLMSGSLNVAYATPQIFLTSTGTNNGDLNFRTGALLRWQLSGNFGTPGDVAFARFDDAGAFIDIPVQIARATGALSANGGVVWSAAMNPAAISGANAYQKLASGMIFQFGYFPGGGDNFVVFPVAFPGLCAGVVATPIGNAIPTNSLLAYHSDGVTTTAFNIRGRFYNVTGPSGMATQAAYWWAWGW